MRLKFLNDVRIFFFSRRDHDYLYDVVVGSYSFLYRQVLANILHYRVLFTLAAFKKAIKEIVTKPCGELALNKFLLSFVS